MAICSSNVMDGEFNTKKKKKQPTNLSSFIQADCHYTHELVRELSFR